MLGERIKVLMYLDNERQERFAKLLSEKLGDTGVVELAGAPLPFGRENWRVRGLDGATVVDANDQPENRRIIARVVDLFCRLRNVSAMIRKAAPDVVVVMEDNVANATSFVAEAARSERCPVVIVPDYIPNAEEQAQWHSGDPNYHVNGPLRGLLGWLLPHWVYRHDGRSLFRMPPARILLHLLLGMRPLRPWIMNAGYATSIALDSVAAERRYLALGFDAAKLAITGSVVSDTIAAGAHNREERRSQLCCKYNLESDRPLIVCAFPPSQYAESKRDKYEYSSFERLAEGWFEVLEEASALSNVLIAPHPRLAADQLRPFERPSLAIADDAIEKLIPLADLYIASASTTIGWALSAGVPVVNYDCYRYEYEDFVSSTAVIHVTARQSFRDELLGLLKVPQRLIRLQRVGKNEAPHWGMLDGKSLMRLAELLRKVASQPYSAIPTHPKR
jgi:hypothetical protein